MNGIGRPKLFVRCDSCGWTGSRGILELPCPKCDHRSPAPFRAALSVRSASRALSNYTPVPETGCWLWLGSWDKTKYGKTGGRQGSDRAHRLFYEQLVGPIPDGAFLCHKCDTPPCVNPDHMFLGNRDENMKDMARKGRSYQPAGEMNVKARLSDAQAAAIFRDRRSADEIAGQYGVSKASILSIKNGTRWRHLNLTETAA